MSISKGENMFHKIIVVAILAAVAGLGVVNGITFTLLEAITKLESPLW